MGCLANADRLESRVKKAWGRVRRRAAGQLDILVGGATKYLFLLFSEWNVASGIEPFRGETPRSWQKRAKCFSPVRLSRVDLGIARSLQVHVSRPCVHFNPGPMFLWKCLCIGHAFILITVLTGLDFYIVTVTYRACRQQSVFPKGGTREARRRC